VLSSNAPKIFSIFDSSRASSKPIPSIGHFEQFRTNTVLILFAFFSVLCWALKIRIDFIYFMAYDFLVFLWPNSFILRCGIVMGDLEEISSKIVQ
jgi:hypothetical protein